MKKTSGLNRVILAILVISLAAISCQSPSLWQPTVTVTPTPTATATMTPTTVPTQTATPIPAAVNIEDFWRLPDPKDAKCEDYYPTRVGLEQITVCEFNDIGITVVYESFVPGVMQWFLPVRSSGNWDIADSDITGAYYLDTVDVAVAAFSVDNYDLYVTVVSESMTQQELYDWARKNIIILESGIPL